MHTISREADYETRPLLKLAYDRNEARLSRLDIQTTDIEKLGAATLEAVVEGAREKRSPSGTGSR